MSPASDRPAISRRGRERRIMVNRIGVAGSIGIRGNQGRSKLHLSRESFSGADSHGSNSSTRPPKAYHALKVSGTSNHRPRMCPPGIPQTAFPEDVEARPSRVVGNPEVGPQLQGLLRRSRAAYPTGTGRLQDRGRETGSPANFCPIYCRGPASHSRPRTIIPHNDSGGRKRLLRQPITNLGSPSQTRVRGHSSGKTARTKRIHQSLTIGRTALRLTDAPSERLAGFCGLLVHWPATANRTEIPSV